MRDLAEGDDAMTETRLLPLTVRGLCYDVPGSRLIDGVDLRLGGRGTTVIMGPNGAGKSLILRLLHGLLTPTGGTILWGGQPPGPDVTRRQSLVFQKPVLLRRSAAANVDFVLASRGRKSPETRDGLLARVGLAGLGARPARRLSGGEQQRLALARALATDPEVLLLDEPTANLDPASTAAIEAIVADAARGGTRVLFVTHDIGQARRLADDVVFVAGGRVTEHAPAAGFFAGPATPAARAYLAGHLAF